MSHILHRNPRTTLARAVSAEGSTIVDHLGRRYLDASGGAAVSCLGHRHPDVVAAIRAQLDAIEYAHTSFFTTDAAEELAALLAEQSPPSLGHAYFVSGGSEAVETALKMARHYFVASGRPSKARFIARRQSYHGNTIAALGLGGNAARRALYEPLMAPSVHVSPCFAFRWRERGESDEAYATRLARELEETILALGAENVAGFVAETVVGATAGAVAPVPGYFRKIREVCDRHQVLLVADEIITGFGRTGRWFGVEHHDVVPDVITFGKGIGGGVVPLSGMVATAGIRDVVGTAPNGFSYGHTFSGYPLGCAVGCAVIDTIEQEGLVEEADRKGTRIRAELEQMASRHPLMHALRGRGLLQGIELRHPATGERFAAADRISGRVATAARERGLMIYPCPTPILNEHMDAVMLAPPLIISDTEVDEMLGTLDAAVAAVESSLA
jgi:adenosylmethionine-8-amino-7-oxononanoate aminotransferase